MTSNDIAKRDETGLVVMDYGDVAVTGFENQSEDDRSKVWLKLLQAGSPECKNRNRVEGAAPGKFYHTGTGRLWDGEEGVEIIACMTESGFVEWKPDGAGFVGRHEKNSDVYNKARAYSEERGIFPWRIPVSNANGDIVPGNFLKDTRYIHALAPGRSDDSPWEFASIALDSTKLKPYRRIMDRLWRFRIRTSDGKEIRPPLYAVVLRLRSYDEEDKGQEYSALRIEAAAGDDLSESLLAPNDPRFLAAREIAQGFREGSIKVDYSSVKDETDSNSSEAFGDEF